MPTSVRLKQFWKLLLTVPGIITEVVSLGFLHGQALHVAMVAGAVLSSLLVALGPSNKVPPAVQGEPMQSAPEPAGNVDVGPGTTVVASAPAAVSDTPPVQ